MKIIKRLSVGLVILVLLVLFFRGPSLIQALYRSSTPDSVMKTQRKEYERLDNAEIHLTGPAKIENQKARLKLYLWFYARGFPIDEGDGEVPFWQPWRNLIDYWDGDDQSRYFPSNSEPKSK
jgi:hypothetical protein